MQQCFAPVMAEREAFDLIN